MIEFKKKITYWNESYMQYNWAKYNKLGTICYDQHGKRWEIGEDINFDKFWFREVKK